MTDTDLINIYQPLLKAYFPEKKYKLAAEFYKSGTVRHTIELKWRTIRIRVSSVLMESPQEILEALGVILLAKLFRHKIDVSVKKTYDAYIEQKITPNLLPKKQRSTAHYSAHGRFYDLDQLFAELNQLYFDGVLKRPVLGWSQRLSYTRLGFYDSERNLLVLSSIFDSAKTKVEVLKFLMYHEMLHIYLPAQRVNGRRRIHPAKFKAMERRFPDYEKIQKWIKKKRHRL